MATAAQRRRAELAVRKLSGIDDARPYYGAGGAVSHANVATAGGLPRRMPAVPGVFSIQRGRTPNEADIRRYMLSAGMGDPNAIGPIRNRPMQLPQRVDAGSSYQQRIAANRPQELSLTEQAFADAMAQNQRAFDETLNRYGQIVSGRLGVHDRAMSEAENWGKAQAKLNEERAREALDSQMAALEASGIANSNVLPAFAQRNARDLALTQQALSEAVSNRKIGYDTSLSDEVYDAVERRNDIPPDTNQLISLAMEYEKQQAAAGENGDLRRQIDEIKNSIRQGRAPRRSFRSIRPVMGGIAPVFMNAGSMGYGMPQLVSLGPRTSNRYPRRRAPEEYAAIANAVAKRRNASGSPNQILTTPQYRQPLNLYPTQRAYA